MDDDLLADLDELGGSDDDELEEMDSRDRLAQEALMASIADASDVRNLLKIYNSKQLQDLRLRIDGFLRSDRMTDAAVEDDPEYPVIVQANNLSVGLENEIAIVHKVWNPAFNCQFGVFLIPSLSSSEIITHLDSLNWSL